MKSKSIVLIIIAILLLILVGGASYMKLKQTSVQVAGSNEKSVPSNIFTSVKDALSKDISLICEFKDDKGTSTKSYIKNGAVRISTIGGTSENQSGEIIMRDKKMYMWDIKSKQGFVYDIPDNEDNSIGATNEEINQSESYLNMIETYKDSCKVSTIEDSYFTIPTDIKFQDMSKLLEDLKKQMPQIPQQ